MTAAHLEANAREAFVLGAANAFWRYHVEAARVAEDPHAGLGVFGPPIPVPSDLAENDARDFLNAFERHNGECVFTLCRPNIRSVAQNEPGIPDPIAVAEAAEDLGDYAALRAVGALSPLPGFPSIPPFDPAATRNYASGFTSASART